ncbi:uncharacterized protein LOC123683998 [Harmonia axyridis]|uniref:uncharacterized protein LOC123683998 n=1 Tax=Harmonia axyridis TaxID=115357 RepID=UPI001E2785DB|nr:uncharacterized protein LOC123683998 [Harmonia axyridis]
MSGSGRGRGWLRLGPNAVSVRPGLDPISNDPVLEDKNGYDDLIKKFEFLNIEDDGITVNNKIYHIRDEFMKKCPTINLIREAMEAIHEECLRNERFSEKFVLFISSAHFENKQKSEEQILWRNTTRKEFISWLQQDFECSEKRRDEAPSKFYNALKLCSNFFYSIKKFQSKGYPILEGIAVMGYINQLLHYRDVKEIKTIIYLACRHSSIILQLMEENSPQFEDFLCKLKLKLIQSSPIPMNNILLFFTYELITHRYELTKEELEFYRRNINKDDFSEISVLYDALPQPSTNCHEHDTRKKTEEQRGCKLEMNGVDNSFFQQPIDQVRLNSPEEKSVSSSILENSIRPMAPEEKLVNYRFVKSNGSFYSDKIDRPREPLNLNGLSESLNPPERVGRPILGVGARLKRN